MLRISFFLVVFGCLPGWAQISPEKLATRMDKGKWQKVEQSLRKALSKDSLDPENHYLLALYFFTPHYPSFNLDSAYGYSKNSWKIFQRTSLKERERLKRVPLDSLHLSELTQKIDSVSFEKAKLQNTEPAYQYFIEHHPAASQVPSAIELRDEVAFLEALKVNTWFSFRNFMTRHPASHRKAEAQTKFDRLLFEDKTRDQRLASYIRFLLQFPESPYGPLAEKTIFEISTAPGTAESFQWFIENYPSSKWSKTAKNILYRLLPTEEENIFNPAWMTDSLRQVEMLNKPYWVPVLKSGLFGFMDENGTEVITPKFENIPDDYKCGDLMDRLLATSNGLIARNGAVLWKGKIKETKEIGLGYVLISSDSNTFVLHESGFKIGPNAVEGAQLIGNRFIALGNNKKWAVYSLTGKALVPFSFDEITSFDSLIVLAKGGKKILTTPARLARIADKGELKEDFVFDDARRWGNQQYWVRNGLLEGVIDASLNFVIPLDRQVLRKTSFGFLRGKDDKLFVKGLPRLENTPYKLVNEQAGWVRVQTEKGRYLLYDKTLDRLIEGDSAWFLGRLAFIQSGDSVKTFLPTSQELSFSGHSSFQFKEYRDSAAWFVLEEKKKKSVFDAASGIKLFTMDFDQIEALSLTVFSVTKMNKKGLLSEDGKVLVPIEYDAIVSAGNNSFSLLKEKKFGWYDAGTKILIKPAFDQNIKPYNALYRIAFKDKGYGFILPDGKPAGTFEWEDIQFWNDSSAWVKKNFQWMLFAIRSQKVKLEKVRSFSVVKDTPLEKIYIVHQEVAFGVISNRRGIIVPIQYSDIINLGSKEVPMYFTERHIEEAGISVVVYYDSQGKIVRKQAMEAEEFERIVCDN